MIISLNWLKQYVDLSGVSTDQLAELIGARLVEIEEVIDNTHKYDNIFIVKVVECEKVADSDHLSLTKIDDRGIMENIDPHQRDERGYISVVCGAPNAHADMLAVWIAPGAVVPATFNTDEPFTISVRKMRGLTSNGMLAALDELGLGEDHEGIVELPAELAEPGTKFTDVFAFEDILLDIENKSLTHRPDCFGIIGFAREVAGILDQKFETPEWFNQLDLPTQNSEALTITISDSTLCPRYSAAILDNFSDESTASLTPDDVPLIQSGMRPISKIVDVTNYLMLLTGQPLHAFDYDKLIRVGGTDKPHIIVRTARPGETLELLDGKTVELTENDILITSNDVPVALAGAMGGASTAIDETTKRVVIESATFSLYNLRKTSMHHGLFSEAVTRFTKGQPPALTAPVLREAVKLLEQLGMKQVAVADAYPEPLENHAIPVSVDLINSVLGTSYDDTTVKKTLENTGFSISGDEYTAPFWRTDVHIAEDVIEEIGRLLGYDNIPQALPRRAFTAAAPDSVMAFKTKLRNQLSSLGANEVITYGFVSERLLKNADQDPSNSYSIVNSISPALELVRQSLTPSLLEKTYVNYKAGYEHFALFEMNQVFQKSYGLTDDNVPVTRNHLALTIIDATATANGATYYKAKRYADQLFKQLGIDTIYSQLTTDVAATRPFEPKRSAIVTSTDGKTAYGVVGELKASVRKDFKLPEHVAAFELDIDTLISHQQQPGHLLPDAWIKRDLTLSVPADEPYATTAQRLQKIAEANQLTLRIIPASIYQVDGDATKNVSFHLEIAAPKPNLTRNDINQIMEKFS